MRRANKDNADYAVIIGEDELESGDVIVKSLSDQNSEQSNMKLNDLRDFISNLK
jgi:histidyl-tRNA synthetase